MCCIFPVILGRTLPSATNINTVTCDSTGQYVAVGTSGNGGIYFSSNFGVTFSLTTATTTTGWVSLTSSSDVSSNGTDWQLTAANKNGYVYLSTDSGSSWTAQAVYCTGGSWQCVTSDSKGQYLTANCLNGTTSSIYYSKNNGNTWTLSSTVFANQLSPYVGASQSTSQYMIVGAYAINTIYTSNNNGKSWVANSGPPNIAGPVSWGPVAMDQTGQFASMAATLTEDGEQYAAMFFSQNYGATWIRTSGSNKYFYGVSVDYNGTRWVAGGNYLMTGKTL